MKENKDITREDEVLDIRYLTGADTVIKPLGSDFITVTRGGEDFERATLHRSMPFSYPDRFIVVKDAAGKEIGLISDIADFDAETSALISRMLSLRYYCPKVLEILDLKDKFGLMYVTMKTDSGMKSFASPDLTKSVKGIGGDRYVIVDLEGNRFLIEDLFKVKNHKKIMPYIV